MRDRDRHAESGGFTAEETWDQRTLQDVTRDLRIHPGLEHPAPPELDLPRPKEGSEFGFESPLGSDTTPAEAVPPPEVTLPGVELSRGAAELQLRMGHAFGRPELLVQALTDRGVPAAARAMPLDNALLSFVGGRVLSLALSELLCQFGTPVGTAALHAVLVEATETRALAAMAHELGVHAALQVAADSDVATPDATAMATALTAVIGAIHADKGYLTARTVVLRLWGPRLDEAMARLRSGASLAPTSTQKLSKTLLSVLAARAGTEPVYFNAAERVLDGRSTHTVQARVTIKGKLMTAVGKGDSALLAENDAARQLVAMMKRS